MLDRGEALLDLAVDRLDSSAAEPVLVASWAAPTTSGSRSLQRSSSPSGRYLPGVAARVADEAVGHRLDELGPAGRADPADDLRGGGAHGPDVHPVHAASSAAPSPRPAAVIPPGVTASIGVYSP